MVRGANTEPFGRSAKATVLTFKSTISRIYIFFIKNISVKDVQRIGNTNNWGVDIGHNIMRLKVICCKIAKIVIICLEHIKRWIPFIPLIARR